MREGNRLASTSKCLLVQDLASESWCRGRRGLARAVPHWHQVVVLAIRAVKIARVLVRHAIAAANRVRRLFTRFLFAALGSSGSSFIATGTHGRDLQVWTSALRKFKLANRSVRDTIGATEQLRHRDDAGVGVAGRRIDKAVDSGSDDSSHDEDGREVHCCGWLGRFGCCEVNRLMKP